MENHEDQIPKQVFTNIKTKKTTPTIQISDHCHQSEHTLVVDNVICWHANKIKSQSVVVNRQIKQVFTQSTSV